MNKIIYKNYVFGLIGLAIMSFLFYWFEIRPSNARKDCNDLARPYGAGLNYTNQYTQCMRSRGL